IAFREGVSIDRLRVKVYGEDYRPVTSVDTPVQLTWTAAAARDAGARAEWVARFHRQEFETGWQELRDMPGPGVAIAFAFMLSVPGYFVLQLWFAWAFKGGWRLAALAPLAIVGPALVFSLYALSKGSNLWPITLIFLAPVGFLYLLAVGAARVMKRAFA